MKNYYLKIFILLISLLVITLAVSWTEFFVNLRPSDQFTFSDNLSSLSEVLNVTQGLEVFAQTAPPPPPPPTDSCSIYGPGVICVTPSSACPVIDQRGSTFDCLEPGSVCCSTAPSTHLACSFGACTNVPGPDPDGIPDCTTYFDCPIRS